MSRKNVVKVTSVGIRKMLGNLASDKSMMFLLAELLFNKTGKREFHVFINVIKKLIDFPVNDD